MNSLYIWFLIIVLVIVILVLVWFVNNESTPISSTTNHDEGKWSAWFEQRDFLPESDIPASQWYTRNWNSGWGPSAAKYPKSSNGPGVVIVARHYIGLPYRHHHLPTWDPPSSLTGKPNESVGLDCSNFTAWVYNYGLGKKFTSNVHRQAVMYETESGMYRLDDLNNLTPGDLLFFWRNMSNGETEIVGTETLSQRREISHCAIFTEYKNGKPMIIDSRGEGVSEHPMVGSKYSWYENHFSHAIHIDMW